MKFPDFLEVAGDLDFRGDCPHEHVEQNIFFNLIRKIYPNSYGKIAIHPENEGKRSYGQANFSKSQGMTKGAADVIIPGDMSFAIEIKRKDHTKSKWEDGQIEYLEASIQMGCITFVALGGNAAFERFNELLGIKYGAEISSPDVYRPIKLF
ncbi:MAG: hypothetical protein ACPGJH_07065 [Alphaproteobacteria bacterium]